MRTPFLPTPVKSKRLGRLKVFVGACPGVGKTWAMLNTARELQQQQGIRILAGMVDAHGQPEIGLLLSGFEILSYSEVGSHNHRLNELSTNGL